MPKTFDLSYTVTDATGSARAFLISKLPRERNVIAASLASIKQDKGTLEAEQEQRAVTVRTLQQELARLEQQAPGQDAPNWHRICVIKIEVGAHQERTKGAHEQLRELSKREQEQLDAVLQHDADARGHVRRLSALQPDCLTVSLYEEWQQLENAINSVKAAFPHVRFL